MADEGVFVSFQSLEELSHDDIRPRTFEIDRTGRRDRSRFRRQQLPADQRIAGAYPLRARRLDGSGERFGERGAASGEKRAGGVHPQVDHARLSCVP